MLQITIPATELWDEAKQEFIFSKEYTLSLEHSLVSISKWESKYCKPFLGRDKKTTDEFIYYVKCMTITQNVPNEAYINLTVDNIKEISKYIEAPMTATWFSKDASGKMNKETVTSELIYYWMIALNIPSEYQKWHLNRLLTLIHVCNIKNQPPKKHSKKEIMNRNTALNNLRRAQMHTKG